MSHVRSSSRYVHANLHACGSQNPSNSVHLGTVLGYRGPTLIFQTSIGVFNHRNSFIYSSQVLSNYVANVLFNLLAKVFLINQTISLRSNCVSIFIIRSFYSQYYLSFPDLSSRSRTCSDRDYQRVWVCLVRVWSSPLPMKLALDHVPHLVTQRLEVRLQIPVHVPPEPPHVYGAVHLEARHLV